MRLLSWGHRQAATEWLAKAAPYVEGGAEQSRRLGHEHVGTEHVLLALADDSHTRAGRALARLGLTREVVRCDIERMIGTCDDPRRRVVDADALATLGIDLDDVTRRVEESFGPGALERSRSGVPDRRPGDRRWIAPRLRKALELAAADAGGGHVRAERVLAALAEVEDCVAARILAEHGVSTAALHEALNVSP